MSEDSKKQRLKKLAEFRSFLQKRLEETRFELENLQNLIDVIDIVLVQEGFKHPEVPKEAVSREIEVVPSVAYKSVIPVKTVTGELLANIYVGKDVLHVITAKDKDFNVNTPPFNSFLIERVLKKMQEKDQNLARDGKITPDKILSFNIIREGDIIREIVVRNVSDERVRELKSSIRWTLEKMYEKMVKE